MKKKYRVTTRGKIVFPLIGLLLIYGLYLLIAQASAPTEHDLTPSMPKDQEASVAETENNEVVDVKEIDAVTADVNETDAMEMTTKDEVVAIDVNEDKMTEQLKLLEDAGFTIYYEPNAYYVPESDLAFLIKFAEIAGLYPDEQIVIEGNINSSIGPESEWDTEDVDQLAYTRALVIKNDLIKRGIDKDRLVIYNNKDEKALNVDLSPESIALNRRVDVFFSQFMYKEINTK